MMNSTLLSSGSASMELGVAAWGNGDGNTMGEKMVIHRSLTTTTNEAVGDE